MRRREFLGYGAAGVSFVSLAGGMPGLFADAAEGSAKADANDHALVVIELTGGNDGLNTLIPFEDALYYRNRPTLAIPKAKAIKLNDRVAFHPGMKALAELFREGRVAVVQGVGYPQPDRSHFRSMEIWHTASTAPKPAYAGWLGRYLDESPAAAKGFPYGLALTDSLPQALQAERVSVPVVAMSDDLSDPEDPEQSALLRRLTTETPTAGTRRPVAFLRRQASTFYRTADRLRQATEKYRSTVEYPEGELGSQLRRAAQILAADLGVRVLFVAQDGYDTHADQADQQGARLEELSTSLAAFQKDLVALKHDARVSVLVFSEFGRRVDENASRGTDHGAGSCLFLVGSKIKGGLAGHYPGLSDLGDGDLIFNTDFRSVYATLLERWLGCPSEKTLGGRYPTLDLI